MKGKSLGVVNQNYRNGFERTFSKKNLPECPGCKEVPNHLRTMNGERSCTCIDCGRTLLNPEHKTPEEG